MAAPSRRQWPDLGAGSSHSPAERAVSDRPLSVVAMLASRSLTGRGMGMEVHNHYAGHLHLPWKGRGEFRRRCVGRTIRPDAEARRFERALCEGRLSGVATCVYVVAGAASHGRAPLCGHEVSQDDGHLVMCTCRVQSACLVGYGAEEVNRQDPMGSYYYE
jgi:hypothetical protein